MLLVGPCRCCCVENRARAREREREDVLTTSGAWRLLERETRKYCCRKVGAAADGAAAGCQSLCRAYFACRSFQRQRRTGATALGPETTAASRPAAVVSRSWRGSGKPRRRKLSAHTPQTQGTQRQWRVVCGVTRRTGASSTIVFGCDLATAAMRGRRSLGGVSVGGPLRSRVGRSPGGDVGRVGVEAAGQGAAAGLERWRRLASDWLHRERRGLVLVGHRCLLRIMRGVRYSGRKIASIALH